MRLINLIVLHCSASDNPNVDAAEVRRWHLARGFKDIGYHFFIKTDGTLELGRNLELVGAHVAGFNKNSIGICLNGLKATSFQESQFESLRSLLKTLKPKFPQAFIKGHNELNPKKACPVYQTQPFKDYWASL